MPAILCFEVGVSHPGKAKEEEDGLKMDKGKYLNCYLVFRKLEVGKRRLDTKDLQSGCCNECLNKLFAQVNLQAPADARVSIPSNQSGSFDRVSAFNLLSSEQSLRFVIMSLTRTSTGPRFSSDFCLIELRSRLIMSDRAEWKREIIIN